MTQGGISASRSRRRVGGGTQESRRTHDAGVIVVRAWGAEYVLHVQWFLGFATTHNCEGFRLRGPWRGPSDLTSVLSRLVRGTSRARPKVRKPLIR